MREVDVLQANRLLSGGLVTLLSSRKDRNTNVMAASWIVPLSTNPPLLGVSIIPSTWTYRIVRETGEFILNIPDGEMLKTVHACGTTTGREVDKGRLFEITMEGSRMVKPLRVSGCLAHIECEVRDWLKAGDRSLVVAEILHACADEEYFDGQWAPDAPVLRYLGGSRYQCQAEIFEVRKVDPSGPSGKVITLPGAIPPPTE
jgi:flavin reductase (DIM6/NTAB) family NADH-FMN oxidoreductase RutF